MKITIVVCLIAAIECAAQQPGRNCVIDDAPRAPSLVEFRDTLLSAVRARSVERLLPLVHSDVMFGFGSSGRDSFVTAHNLRDPYSQFWAELERDLQLGGRLETADGFCAPYFMCPVWPGQQDDTVFVVLNRDTEARDSGTPGGTTVARLPCGAVAIPADAMANRPRSPAGWTSLRQPTGVWVFVRASEVVLAETWVRLGRVNGKWFVTAIGGID